MSDTNDFPKRIRYEYDEDPKAKLMVAHGVWGGINTQGEIEMNFYAESDKLPSTAERIFAPDGTLGPELSPEEEEVRTITRHVHSKILLNYHTAHALLAWLEEKVESIEVDETSIYLYDDKGIEQ